MCIVSNLYTRVLCRRFYIKYMASYLGVWVGIFLPFFFGAYIVVGSSYISLIVFF